MTAPAEENRFAWQRAAMVQDQLVARGIRDDRVLDAMASVPRERFLPERLHDVAYRDGPLSIGFGQTISQPFMVAAMTEALMLSGSERVLEIGTGSGYQTAVLARLAREVLSVERIAALSEQATRVLDELGVANAGLVVGDGSTGWPQDAPYDRVIVTAASPDVPPALVAQLAPGGILVIPCGSRAEQTLVRIRKLADGMDRTSLMECVFVPLVGAQGWPDDEGTREGP
jgi:protein-L-isoaspartate(D-aspartate) O-methyltransferase